ncbi:hypothetical protein ACROYT_G013920 [Oculina patagonica]
MEKSVASERLGFVFSNSGESSDSSSDDEESVDDLGNIDATFENSKCLTGCNFEIMRAHRANIHQDDSSPPKPRPIHIYLHRLLDREEIVFNTVVVESRELKIETFQVYCRVHPNVLDVTVKLSTDYNIWSFEGRIYKRKLRENIIKELGTFLSYVKVEMSQDGNDVEAIKAVKHKGSTSLQDCKQEKRNAKTQMT